MWGVFWMFNQVNEDVLTLTVGDDDTDARLLYLSGSSVFRVHAATTEGTLLLLDILGEVGTRCHTGDNF